MAIHDLKPLPDELYHVTTAADAVATEGLKTRRQLGQEFGAGLGGGDANTVSFTTSQETAKEIKSALLEARRVARGEVTAKDLWEQAVAGADDLGVVAGAPKPFDEGLLASWNAKRGDPMPSGLRQSLEQKRRVSDVVEPKSISEMPPGSVPDSPAVVGSDGVERFMHWLEPIAEAEKRQQAFDFYQKYAAFRQHAGGLSDPLFTWNDIEGLAALAEDQIQILKVASRKGAYGKQMSSLDEWRSFSGNAVDFLPRVPGARPAITGETRASGNLVAHKAKGAKTWTLSHVGGDEVATGFKTAQDAQSWGEAVATYHPKLAAAAAGDFARVATLAEHAESPLLNLAASYSKKGKMLKPWDPKGAWSRMGPVAATMDWADKARKAIAADRRLGALRNTIRKQRDRIDSLDTQLGERLGRKSQYQNRIAHNRAVGEEITGLERRAAGLRRASERADKEAVRVRGKIDKERYGVQAVARSELRKQRVVEIRNIKTLARDSRVTATKKRDELRTLLKEIRDQAEQFANAKSAHRAINEFNKAAEKAVTLEKSVKSGAMSQRAADAPGWGARRPRAPSAQRVGIRLSRCLLRRTSKSPRSVPALGQSEPSESRIFRPGLATTSTSKRGSTFLRCLSLPRHRLPTRFSPRCLLTRPRRSSST